MSPRPFLLAILLSALPLAYGQSAPAAPAPAPTVRSILLAQLRSTHNKAEWFVPVNTAIAGLTPEQARWVPTSEGGKSNPAPADHSVGMLAYHLLFWNSEQLAKFKGEKGAPIPGDNTETFNKFDSTNWPAVVAQLDTVLTEIEHVVETASDAQLAKWAPDIAHIGTHNAYHTGQIIYVRKLQGTWDPDKGVK